MIRIRDAAVLAYTKLRTHKVRTGVTAGIAGLLFGLIIALTFIVQGVFSSIDRFGQQSLADRTVLNIGEFSAEGVDYEALSKDDDFLSEVQQAHSEYTSKKVAAAQKYDIAYDPRIEDPSPVTVGSDGKKTIDSETMYEDKFVALVVQERELKDKKSFDVREFVKDYPSANVLGDFYNIHDGSGDRVTLLSDNRANGNHKDDNSGIGVAVIDGSVTKPFVSSDSFNPLKGEIPVIIPYSNAMSLLGIKPVDKKATNDEKLAQLREVRGRVDEISVSFCYRNEASRQLLGVATAQADEAKSQENIETGVQYALPETECGPVVIKKDTRTTEEKVYEANMAAYLKEIGEHPGTPVQRKVLMRGVGIVGEIDGAGVSSAAALIHSIVGSNLGYQSWAIPSDLLNQIPEEARPEVIFSRGDKTSTTRDTLEGKSSLVEFTDREDARKIMERAHDMSMQEGDSFVTATEFGSNSLLIDELKKVTSQAIFWALVFVGGVAVIIMASMIGRTVADGRRESAVFRAIGAKRSDIASVYGVYTVLLSLRAILFAVVLGTVIALIVDKLYGGDATVGAHLAYTSVEPSTEFRLINILAPQLPVVILVMLLSGVVASIIPIARSVRRNPINDMRDDT